MAESSDAMSGTEGTDGYPLVERITTWGTALGAAVQRIPKSVHIILLLLVILVPLALLIQYELRTSHMQARFLSAYASELTYETEAGASASIRFPSTGPFNQRLGYVSAPAMIDSLTHDGRLRYQRAGPCV